MGKFISFGPLHISVDSVGRMGGLLNARRNEWLFKCRAALVYRRIS